jgi:hypothetical protein
MNIAKAKKTIQKNIKIGLSLSSAFIVNPKVWVFYELVVIANSTTPF